MGLNVIAEGVEDNYQLSALKQLHCTEAQGYLISRPLTAEDFTPFIANYNSIEVKQTLANTHNNVFFLDY